MTAKKKNLTLVVQDARGKVVAMLELPANGSVYFEKRGKSLLTVDTHDIDSLAAWCGPETQVHQHNFISADA